MKKVLFLSAAFVAIAFAANAQTCAPVDGGLSILLAAGIAGYSAKKVAEKRKKSDVESK